MDDVVQPRILPGTVRAKQFSTTRLRPGYDEGEVDAFLDEIEVELVMLIIERDTARAEIRRLRGEEGLN